MYELSVLYYSIFTSLFYRNTTVYLRCDQSQTTPIATVSGEPNGRLNYVSYKRCCNSSLCST